MNKRILAACLLPLLVLSGCRKIPDHDKLSVFEQGRGDGYMYLTHNDKKYVPYCPFKAKNMGECIGYFNSLADAYTESSFVYVYEFKGYSSDEWIIDYDPEINEGMVMREINTTNIPDGLTSEYEWNK